MAGIADMQLSLGDFQADVDQALQAWSDQGNTTRLWRGDVGLWSGADENKWLGWLHIASEMVDQADALTLFGAQVKDAGFTDVLLLGMGGSSLCPEVLAMTFGSREGWPALHVLDSTVPEQVQRFADGLNLETTLCIVASKSGTTTEPHAFCEFFWAEMQKSVGDAAGQHFVAITDPDSELERLANDRDFRAIFHGLPHIGGRFSALSNFGMVPGALVGLDVHGFLDRAVAMSTRCGVENSDDQNPGLVLGLVLGTLAQKGKDKVTLVTSPALWDFGAWLEQLIAESTGKRQKGLVPIDLEALAQDYGDDRVFVYIRLANDANAELDTEVERLRTGGFPVIELEVSDPLELGAEFFRWEFATAVVGSLMQINPFDQPNVQESKDFTAELTQAFEKEGRLPLQTPFLIDDGIAVYADQANTTTLGNVDDFQGCVVGLLDQVQPGDYVAICAYLDMNEAITEALQSIRHQIRDAKGVATTLGFGPRFLHSTGQLHKGGPNKVVVVQVTSDDPVDVDIPGRAFSFGVLKDAQALGDARALSSRNRRAIRIHFKTDLVAGINRISQMIK